MERRRSGSRNFQEHRDDEIVRKDDEDTLTFGLRKIHQAIRQ